MIRFLFIASILLPALPDENVLEPSIRNEVSHALSRASKDEPKKEEKNDSEKTKKAINPFSTNGLSKTEIAIKLVSLQNSDGRWIVGTNDFTSVACEILESL